jgi:predicted nucleic acid-binding protein
MILLDTNVLARAAQPGHSQYPLAVTAVEVLCLQNETLCLVPQVLYEYWVIATRPVAQNGLGMTAAEAAADLAAIVQRMHIYRDERAIFDGWQKLVAQYQVLGKNAHDARLVAAMQRHGIARILTFNTSDFSRFSGIQILDPRQVAMTA